MKSHESAAWLYGFLAAVRSGDLYAPPHVVEVVERVLERYERVRNARKVEAGSVMPSALDNSQRLPLRRVLDPCCPSRQRVQGVRG
jgi:hypothetical protein